jgi:hypothetical protein
MKTMTCKQLGGDDIAFHANSFEEMASKRYAWNGNGSKWRQAHMEAMKEMSDLMKTPDAMDARHLKEKGI